MQAEGGRSARRRRNGLVVLVDAADDYAVLFNRDLDRSVPGPVLGVDGVVLDGGVKPQAIALLAVVKRALQGAGFARGSARAGRARAAASTTATGAPDCSAS